MKNALIEKKSLSDEPIIVSKENDIKNLVYNIRGKQVMLDSDLAKLYQVETKRLNESVKRNEKRFPESFCFQLSEEECNRLNEEYSTEKDEKEYGGRRYLPYAFTEPGIAMLSAVLKSEMAIQVSIRIMNTFVEMRRFMTSNTMMLNRINQLEIQQTNHKKEADEKFERIFEYISSNKESNQKIFFEGQIYDAHSILIKTIQKAKKNIKLVDGYIDINTLDIIAKKESNIPVAIYTHTSKKVSQNDINKFNSQYSELEIKNTRAFHDRFIIIDDEEVYHIGASIKDAGKKCFGMSKILDDDIKQQLLNKLNEI